MEKARVGTLSGIAVHYLPLIPAQFQKHCSGMELIVPNDSYAETEATLFKNNH